MFKPQAGAMQTGIEGIKHDTGGRYRQSHLETNGRQGPEH
jgi:hypothetical protein